MAAQASLDAVDWLDSAKGTRLHEQGLRPCTEPFLLRRGSLFSISAGGLRFRRRDRRLRGAPSAGMPSRQALWSRPPLAQPGDFTLVLDEPAQSFSVNQPPPPATKGTSTIELPS